MKNLTEGSIALHILSTAPPVAISVVAHIAYQIISLYFISKLGVEVIAGVNW